MHIACHELERVDLRRFVNDEPSHRRHRECAAIEQRWVGQHIQRAKHESRQCFREEDAQSRHQIYRDSASRQDMPLFPANMEYVVLRGKSDSCDGACVIEPDRSAEDWWG